MFRTFDNDQCIKIFTTASGDLSLDRCYDLHASYLFFQAKLKDPSSAIRATVVASVRHTFADNAQSYDELLSPLIVDFLSLVKDSDLVCLHSNLGG